jgi:hypothetical protein
VREKSISKINRFQREIDCRFAGENFCRRTEESLAGESTHIFTKSQRLSFKSGRAIQSDAEVTQESRTFTQSVITPRVTLDCN